MVPDNLEPPEDKLTGKRHQEFKILQNAPISVEYRNQESVKPISV